MELLLSEPDEIRVLHIDDDQEVAETTAAFLEREDDITVAIETDPTVVVDRLHDDDFDCVVSDYDMPAMDGLELLNAVRDEVGEIPFTLYTGKGSEEIAADAIEAGVDSYLQKEVGTSNYVVLTQRIRSVVDQHRAERRVEKAREVYELLARVSTDAFWIRDMTTKETVYSEGIERFGYEPGLRDDGLEWWLERVHPDDRDEARSLNESQEAAEPAGFDSLEGTYGEFTFRYRWRCADGSYIDCLSRGVVRFDDGDGVEMVGAMTDLSQWSSPES